MEGMKKLYQSKQWNIDQKMANFMISVREKVELIFVNNPEKNYKRIEDKLYQLGYTYQYGAATGRYDLGNGKMLNVFFVHIDTKHITHTHAEDLTDLAYNLLFSDVRKIRVM